MRLIDDQEEIFGKVRDQRVRRVAGVAAVEPPRIILDAGAVADVDHPVHVESRARAQSLRLQQLALRLEPGQAFFQFAANPFDGFFRPLLGRDEVLRREHEQFVHFLNGLSADRVDNRQPVDLVAE